MRLALAASLVTACASQPAAPPAQPSQTTGGLEHSMMNCPSAVDGAVTHLEPTPTGVDVIVTARDPGVRDEIVALAEYHARIGTTTDWPEHTGHHGGPGTIGHCPVIHDRTLVAVARVADGVMLHVTTAVPEHVKEVQDETAQRLAHLPHWLPR